MSHEEFRSAGTDLPVALTYTTSLQVGQINRPVEQLYFKNPYRAPMWVDEFHFKVSGLNYLYEAIGYFRVPFQLFSMRLKVNGKYIVDEFVPLALLGPHTDAAESFISINGAAVEIDQTISFFWRLAKPMWLDELDDVTIELAWQSNLDIYYSPSTVAALSVPVAVTMCGRSTKNKNRPKERYLPFNVVWGPQLFVTSLTAETALTSPDNALRNGKDVPVIISRMLGFTDVMFDSVGVNSTTSMDTDVLMNMRISHSLGYYLVKDLTPFFELFQNESRAVDLKFVLNPKEFITIELQTLASSGFTAPARYLQGFSLQGYSTETLR